jgi:hypothetical protein
MAGALGIEPRPSVLETDVLAVEHHAPLQAAEKVLQLRSRVAKILDVALGYASGFGSPPASLDGLFEQPAGPRQKSFSNSPAPRASGAARQFLFHFLMRRVLSAETAIFISLNAIRIVLLVFHRRIIALLTDRTRH